MDRFLEAVASFLGVKRHKKKTIDKRRRVIALNINSSGTNELTVQETENKKEGKLKDKGKLFVGGLNFATTSEELSAYFSKFGDVINAVVIKHPTSGKSRGFGFVSFLDPADAEKALQTKYHVLHGRTIECRPSESKVDSKENKPKNSGKARVFLGGLPDAVTKEELEQFFSRYGKIISVYVPVDGVTKKGKGYAFISFENEEAAEKCIADRFVYLKGRRVFMNKTNPRDVGPRVENGMSGSQGTTLSDPDSCEECAKDSASLLDEDTQSSSSGQVNFELDQHPEFQQLFQNYFAQKLNNYSEMSGRETGSRKHQVQNSEINTLENFFRNMSVNSSLDLDQDTESESADSDTSDESYEGNCENLVSLLSPQIDFFERGSKNSVGKSTSKVTLPFEKDEKERPDLKFSTQDFTEGRLNTPMNFKNKTGTLTCTVCQWIPPDQSFETFLAHCKTPAHRINLIERFPEHQGVKVESKGCVNNEKQKDSLSKANFYPKVTSFHPGNSQRQNIAENPQECQKIQAHPNLKLLGQPLPQQLIKQEVQTVEKAKKKKKKKKQNQEQTVLNSAQESKATGVPSSGKKMEVTQSEKQSSQKHKKATKTNNLNLKFFALAKGMASIHSYSEKSLVCEVCDKQIPSSQNFDSLMKSLLMHLQSKKHLQKLVKSEDKLKILLLEDSEPENDGSSDKKVKSPKDQNSLSTDKAPAGQEKTVPESKKTQNAAAKQEKVKTDDSGVRFLCLQCNFSDSSFGEFARHLESEGHLRNSTAEGVLGAKNAECTECSSCKTFLFGSLFDMNVHFSTCLKKKG